MVEVGRVGIGGVCGGGVEVGGVGEGVAVKEGVRVEAVVVIGDGFEGICILLPINQVLQ